MTQKNDDIFGLILILTLLFLLAIAGYLSYKSIDKDILNKLENKPIIIPTPIPTTPISTNSAVSP